jgi:hypothetical protein
MRRLEVTMVVRVALSAVLLIAAVGCAPKGGNLGRRVNAPTPDGVDAALPAPVLPAAALSSLPD